MGQAELDVSGERIRKAVRRDPRAMTSQLARELGIPEAEVVRALPDGRAVELDVSRWEGLLRALEAVGPVWVLVSSGAATVEVAGRFGGFSTAGEYFNVRTESLDLHVRGAELGAAFAVEKPAHTGGAATYSFQFFDRFGAAALKVFLNFGKPIPPDRLQHFARVRDEHRKPAPSGADPGRPL